ncbi:MAG TPA: hypothetical protein DEF21_21510 [Thalassospira lucentensis]|uniref:Uncharacterized protein n=1 Tax=Thalassospira lucentensis TaxID=168935 RepID=A0A358HZ74_9PROT|nr:hypothetical protein [Thalassospira lucentensis]HCW69049.1 hypothetical protein [Thalassospira lucentensis]
MYASVLFALTPKHILGAIKTRSPPCIPIRTAYSRHITRAIILLKQMVNFAPKSIRCPAFEIVMKSQHATMCEITVHIGRLPY